MAKRLAEARSKCSRGRFIPRPLKAEAVQLCELWLERGLSQVEVGARLGIAGATVSKWIKKQNQKQSIQPQPVRVRMESKPLTLISPNGWRVQGLSHHEIFNILERGV